MAWTMWALNSDPEVVLPHTLKREDEDWLDVANETAGALRVDVADKSVYGDLDGDGAVNVADLLMLLEDWGECRSGACAADLTGDGFVDVADLLELLGAWG